MKPTIKIYFTDFWPGFIKEDNYFVSLLEKLFSVRVTDNKPDVLFYSCYGNEYLNFNCTRIFFSSENMRPDFTACDFAITFDLLNDPRHFRLPLFFYYIDQRGKTVNDLVAEPNKDELRKKWRQKSKFCCMVVSNARSKKRIDFFRNLSMLRTVDSGGAYMNNVGGRVTDKASFIRNYKFVVSFENSSFPGYTTEKIFEPILENCIPVYWGNPMIHLDFNKKRFLNYDDFTSEKELFDEMMELENNEEKALKILMEPMFPNNQLPPYLVEENLLNFLVKCIQLCETLVPVAQQWNNRFMHEMKRKAGIAKHYVDSWMGKTFR